MKSELTFYRPTIWQRVKSKFNAYKVKDWLIRAALKLIVYLNRDSNYISHIRREVPEWFKEDGPNKWMADGTIELLAVLASQGHSGGSIGFALYFFKKMAKFEPWGPLTGADGEWSEPYCGEGTRQNLRCSHVFKEANGLAYDGTGKIFREKNGACYTNSKSRVYITFPYEPKAEYVDVAE